MAKRLRPNRRFLRFVPKAYRDLKPPSSYRRNRFYLQQQQYYKDIENVTENILYLYNIESDGRINTGLWEDASTTEKLVKDYQGVYQKIPAGAVPVENARATYDRSKLFATFQATDATPSPLANARAEGAEHAWMVAGNLGGVFASGINFDGAVSDGDILDVFVADAEAVTRFYFNSNQLIGSVPDLSANINLVYFYCNNNQLTGPIPDLSNNINLVYFYCYNNQLTGPIPDLSNNVNLRDFYCDRNALTGAIPDLSANTGLRYFYCDRNALTGYSGTAVLATLRTLSAFDNSLSETAVNDILIQCDDAGLGSGFTLALQGGTNAVPTGAGLTAKDNLIARGASVTTN